MPTPTTPMVTIIITLRLRQTPYLNSSIISSRQLKGMKQGNEIGNMNNSKSVNAIAGRQQRQDEKQREREHRY